MNRSTLNERTYTFPRPFWGEGQGEGLSQGEGITPKQVLA